MKKIYYYIIFIFFGIVLFILLNNSETLSIGCPYVERGFNIVNGGLEGNYTYTTLNGLLRVEETTPGSFRDFLNYSRVTSILPIIYLGEFQKEPGGYSLLLQTKHFFLVAGYLIYADRILQETEGETIELFKPKNFGTNKPPIKLKVTDGDNIELFSITNPEWITRRQTYRFVVTGVDGISINMYNTDIEKINTYRRIIRDYTVNLNEDLSICSVSALPVVMSEEYTLPLALNNFISVVPPNAFVVPNNELETNTACDGFFEIYDIDFNRVTRVRGPDTDDDKIGILRYSSPSGINIGFTNVEELSSGSFGSVYTCSNMPMNLVQSSNNRGDKAYAVAAKVYNDPSDSEIDFIRMVYGSNKVGIGWIIKKSYNLDGGGVIGGGVIGGGGGLGTITEGPEESSDSDEPDEPEPEPEPKPPDTYESFYNPYYTEGYTRQIIREKMDLYSTDDIGNYQKTLYFFNNYEFKTTTDNSNIRLSVEIDGEDREFIFNYHTYMNEVFPVDVSNCNLVNARVIEPDDYNEPIVVMEYMDNNLKTLRDTFLVLVDGINILSNVYILLCLEILKKILLSLVHLLAHNLIYIDLKLENVLYRCYIDRNIKIVLGDLGSIQNIYEQILGLGLGQTYQMPEMVLYQSGEDNPKYIILKDESEESFRLANEYFCSWIICLMFLELFGIDLLGQYPILFFQRDFIRAGGGDEVRLLENYYSSEEFMTALTNINQYFDNLIDILISIRPFTENETLKIFTLLKVKCIIKGCLKTIPRLLIGEINTLLNLELTDDNIRNMMLTRYVEKKIMYTQILNDKIMETNLNGDMKAFLVS